VTLTARPIPDFSFVGWSGDAGGTNNPSSIALTGNLSITANFTSSVPNLVIDNTGSQPLLSPPLIITPPANQRVLPGGDANFGVVANGSLPLYYQWRFETATILGATNAFLCLTNVGPADAGNYLVAVNNNACSVTSAPARLVLIMRPFIDPILLRSGGGVRLDLIGTAGDLYAVEWSSNLIEWIPLTTLTNTTGSVEFIDPAPANFTERLYRLKLVPW
jgi:uncharacterized repeat protein (TIGR02543 family)